MNPPLSAADLRTFRSFLASAAGLRFEDDKLQELADLLSRRMAKTKSHSVPQYLERARASQDELGELARVLSVSETYFLRNRGQFDALETLLRHREAGNTRHLRLLSAGCCSGEEAYSLAITIRETLADTSGWTISILGVDLNPDSIKRALEATYTRWSLRETPDAIKDKYFAREGNQYVLDDEVRKMVRFECGNLLERARSWGAGAFDYVFCRNVVMYLTRDATRELVERFARCLATGGYLFLGHAENLRGISRDFLLEHSHGTFYYRQRTARERSETRPLPAPRVSTTTMASTDTSWFGVISRASERIENLSRAGTLPETRHAPRAGAVRAEGDQAQATRNQQETQRRLALAMDLIGHERFDEALRLTEPVSTSLGVEPDVLLVRTMLLVSAGRLEEAETLCDYLRSIDDLNAGAYYVSAICREQAGDLAQAVEHAQAAVYLDSEFAMPHLQLGRLARRAGDLRTARRELSLALSLFPLEDGARIALFGGGFGREALKGLCQAELASLGGNP